MHADPGDPPEQRRELYSRIENSLRSYGAESARVVDVFSETHAMHPTDMQALVIILNSEREGTPATPSLLRTRLGLTSGAVTGVVDRLVRSGHVRREADPDDRRVVRLRHDESGLTLARRFFGPLADRTHAVLDDHSIAELRLVESFLARVSAAMADYRAELDRANPQGSTGAH